MAISTAFLHSAVNIYHGYQTDTEDNHPILHKEVEAAVQLLKKGKLAGVDNIPAELVQAGAEDVITALMTIHNNLVDRRMANPMDPVLSHHASQIRQPAAVPELPNDQPQQPPKQSHAEDGEVVSRLNPAKI